MPLGTHWLQHAGPSEVPNCLNAFIWVNPSACSVNFLQGHADGRGDQGQQLCCLEAPVLDVLGDGAPVFAVVRLGILTVRSHVTLLVLNMKEPATCENTVCGEYYIRN